MRIYLAFSLMILSTGIFFSQNDSIRKRKIDSLNLRLKSDSLRIFRFNKFRPYANLDNRNSFIRNKPVNFQGFQVGIIFKEYHVFGFGYYTMTHNSLRPFRIHDETRSYERYLTLNYSTFFYQYVLIDKRYLEIDLPFEIGFGRYSLKLKDDATSEIFRKESGPIIPLGAGIQVVLKPFRWLGLSSTGGYRYVAEKNVNLDFNGFYYSFGLWLDIRQIYREIKFYGFTKKEYKRVMQQILAN